VIELFLVVRKS